MNDFQRFYEEPTALASSEKPHKRQKWFFLQTLAFGKIKVHFAKSFQKIFKKKWSLSVSWPFFGLVCLFFAIFWYFYFFQEYHTPKWSNILFTESFDPPKYSPKRVWHKIKNWRFYGQFCTGSSWNNLTIFRQKWSKLSKMDKKWLFLY